MIWLMLLEIMDCKRVGSIRPKVSSKILRTRNNLRVSHRKSYSLLLKISSLNPPRDVETAKSMNIRLSTREIMMMEMTLNR